MLKKGILTLFVVALGVFAFGLANADQIDALGSGAAGQAQPATDVYVNPGGLGDALIYGYYNVRNNRDNYFNVVNTDVSNGVRARIRFLEAADIDLDGDGDFVDSNGEVHECNGSFDILDFDICLTPGDVWTGVVRNVGGIATLFSPDDDTYVDIADPRGSNSVIFANQFPNGVAFKATPANPVNVSPAQTMEGYFIVIAENILDEVSSDGNCGPSLDDLTLPVDNVLFGLNYAVDMDTLATFANNAVALGDFSNIPFLFDPTLANPNLGDASPDGLIGVNFALTKRSLYSTYDLEADIAGRTEMIVTFPTKSLTHTCENISSSDDIFDDDRVLVTVWDDEENSPVSVCEFSPCPIGTDTRLPYEVNVIDLNNSEIFTSMVEVPLSISFEYGWLEINLTQAATSSPSPAHDTTFSTQTSLGLPAIAYTTVDIAGGGSTHMMPMQYSADVLGD
jgi:hypothetical protein